MYTYYPSHAIHLLLASKDAFSTIATYKPINTSFSQSVCKVTIYNSSSRTSSCIDCSSICSIVKSQDYDLGDHPNSVPITLKWCGALKWGRTDAKMRRNRWIGMPMEGIGLMRYRKGETDGELARGSLLYLCEHEGCFDVLVLFRRDGMMVAGIPGGELCCGEVGRRELDMKDINMDQSMMSSRASMAPSRLQVMMTSPRVLVAKPASEYAK